MASVLSFLPPIVVAVVAVVAVVHERRRLKTFGGDGGGALSRWPAVATRGTDSAAFLSIDLILPSFTEFSYF